jgi:SulP family sulfate permease
MLILSGHTRSDTLDVEKSVLASHDLERIVVSLAMNYLLPKSVLCLRDYSRRDFYGDLVAGVTVGLVALPLAMAFAISSGMPPQSGIYTAIIAGFLISALGGSKTQIGGPTGAFVVIVYGIVARYGADGLCVCTLMAGLILLLLGVTGLGSSVKYIPRPVIVGFTNGIAVLIASTQIKDFFGLTISKVPGEFFGRMKVLATHFNTVSWRATLLASTAAVLIVLFRKFARRIPAYIVAMAVGTALIAVTGLPVETIGTRFGGIPAGLPSFTRPHFEFSMIGELFPSALTLALLGAIESLLSAVVADRMSGDKHNPNIELVAQGAANLAAPFFGGIPATGAIARTATNVRSGAKTPIAGMVHALTLLCVLLFAAPLARFIPLSVLAAILLVVSYNMGEWHEIPKLLKLTWADIGVWGITFALTIFVDLTVAVETGVVMAALLYIRKVTGTTTVTRVDSQYVEEGWLHILQDKPIPEYVAVFRIHGPFLFGASEKLAQVVERLDALPPIVILRLRNMTAIDATGLQALEDLAETLRAARRTLILCGARPQPSSLMRQAEFEQHVDQTNICDSFHAALERAIVIRFNSSFDHGAA